MKGKNLVWDKKPHSFSLEQTFLSTKDYKVICSISLIIMVCNVIFFIIMALIGKQFQEFYVQIFAAQYIIMIYIYLFIPIILAVRAFLGWLVKNNIRKLDEEISKQYKISRIQDNPQRE